MTDIIINTILTVGSIGGFLFIAGIIRDEYIERKWRKQWEAENERYWYRDNTPEEIDRISAEVIGRISPESIRRLLDREDDWK